jgi:hypothetical protein
MPVAPESRITDGEGAAGGCVRGGTAAEKERGKIVLKLLELSAVPTCQFVGSQKH